MSEATIRGRRWGEVRAMAAGTVAGILAEAAWGWAAPPTSRASTGDGFYGLIDAMDGYDEAFRSAFIGAMAVGLGTFLLVFFAWDRMVERPRFRDRSESTRRPGDRAAQLAMSAPWIAISAFGFAAGSLPLPWPIGIGPSIDGGAFVVVPTSVACVLVVILATVSSIWIIGRLLVEEYAASQRAANEDSAGTA